MSKLCIVFILIFSCLALGSAVLAQTPVPTEANPILTSIPVPYPMYTAGEYKITVDSLTNAGFKDSKSLPAKAGQYSSPNGYFPNYYFQVSDSLAGAQEITWGVASNLVSVFIRKMPVGWTYNDGQLLVKDLDGQPSIYFDTIRQSYYCYWPR